MSVTVRPWKGNRWEADVCVQLPDVAHGRAYRKRTRGFRTRAEALTWGQQHEASVIRSGPPTPRKEVPRLEQFVPEFLESLHAQGRVGENWIVRQESALRVHVLPTLGALSLDRIGNREVDRLVAAMREAGRAASTINCALCALNRALKLAVRWGNLERLPCTIELLPRGEREDQVHGFEESLRLIDAARELDPASHVIVLLGLHAGLRAGEMLGLRWSDADSKGGVLHVRVSLTVGGREKPPKSGRTRTVPLTPTLAGALRDYRARVGLRSERVLSDDAGGPVTHKWLKVRVLPALRRAGLPLRRPLHTLRRTFVTELQHREVPEVAIQAWAGHETASMTRRYTTLAAQRQATWIRRLEEPSDAASTGHVVDTPEELGR